MARISVIVRRHAKDSGITDNTNNILEFGGLRIDTLGHDVFIDGEKTDLTAKEYDLLLYLVRHKGIVMTREQILGSVWGYDYYGYDRTVDWQMKLLRNKLGPYRELLQTIRGVGYKFSEK